MPGRISLGAVEARKPGTVVVDKQGNIYLYDPYDAVLGTMGFNPFKFIGNAVKTVAGTVKKIISSPEVERVVQREVTAAVTPAYEALPPSVQREIVLQVAKQQAAGYGQQVASMIPPWLLPVGIAGAALLLLRGRR